MLAEYEVLMKEHQMLVSEFLNNQMLNQEAKKERLVRTEAVRRRRLCLVRSVLFELLPTSVANVVAPACPPSPVLCA